METFMALFSRMLVFVYDCFDRMVISGYLSGLTRAGNVVHFFREVVGVACLTPEVLRRRTDEYQRWVEAFARNHQTPIEWAKPKVRKEEYTREALRGFERAGRFGVYFILKSMEQGPSYRIVAPKFATADPNYRIVCPQKGRYTHYYFYIRDETLGPMVLRVGSFVPFPAAYWINGHSVIERALARQGVKFTKNDNAFTACADVRALQAAADALTGEAIAARLDYWTLVLGPKFSKRERQAMPLGRFYAMTQIEYCRNFIFRRTLPLRQLFERSCELSLVRLSADVISRIFGTRLTRRHQGKLQTTLERMEHGFHVLRAYFKHSFVKQYEKHKTFLRHEVCSNNLKDFHLKKSLEQLDAVRQNFCGVLDRFAQAQAASFNVHVDYDLFAELARSVKQGQTTIPGIKIQDARMRRLMEALLHTGMQAGGFTTRELHRFILERFDLSAQDYSLTQLRYDLRKLKAHGLIERQGRSYRYNLTERGRKVCPLFVLFHKRIAGPLAGTFFAHRPSQRQRPQPCKIEEAYYKADKAIEEIIELLAA
jgi:hypothetical protein